MSEIDIDSKLKKIFDLASQNYKQGDLNNAEILYKKVLDMYPRHVLSLINLGVIFQKRKDFDASIKCYKKAVIENPDNIIANFNLASLQLPQGLTLANSILTMSLGLVMFTLGIIGEYVGRIYFEVKNRPNVLVKKGPARVSSWSPRTCNII